MSAPTEHLASVRKPSWLSGQDERHAIRLRGASGMGISESVTLLEEGSSAGAARTFTARLCRDAGLSVVSTEAAVLLASEVVASAVTHGHSRPRLTVTTSRGGVRVEVGDLSDAPAEAKAVDLDAESGRGLAMLDMCASSWGVRPKRQGKTVSFEVTRV